MKIPVLVELQRQGNEIDAFLSRIGGDEEIAQMILNKFQEDLTMNQLTKNINEKNVEQIKKSAHTLKGVALNLGFINLSEAAKRLQFAAEKEPEEIHENYGIVLKEYNRIINIISSKKEEP